MVYFCIAGGAACARRAVRARLNQNALASRWGVDRFLYSAPHQRGAKELKVVVLVLVVRSGPGYGYRSTDARRTHASTSDESAVQNRLAFGPNCDKYRVENMALPIVR